jgi:hypothetical protein
MFEFGGVDRRGDAKYSARLCGRDDSGGAEALFAYVSIKAWQALQVLAPERSENISATPTV